MQLWRTWGDAERCQERSNEIPHRRDARGRHRPGDRPSGRRGHAGGGRVRSPGSTLEFHDLARGLVELPGRTGNTLPDETLHWSRSAWTDFILGPHRPCGLPEGAAPECVNPHPIIRKHFDLFANLRPARSASVPPPPPTRRRHPRGPREQRGLSTGPQHGGGKRRVPTDRRQRIQSFVSSPDVSPNGSPARPSKPPAGETARMRVTAIHKR